jgi:putative transferase (TIGR04331 family)
MQMLYDRWFMLNQALEEYDITKCYVIKREEHTIVPNDAKHFDQLYAKDDWNEAIYSQLLENFFSNRIELVGIFLNSEQRLGKSIKKVKFSLKETIVNFSNKIFNRKNDYFLISTYLPFLIEIKLQLKLGQIPKIWPRLEVPKSKVNRHMRQWDLCKDKDKDKFGVVIREFIPQHIPIAYLEGYQLLSNYTCELSWPSKPKAIFTSNSYNTDDVFKCWMAEKVELGTPLIIGQHGGHFGMTPFAFHEQHQIKISDKWISWGWKDGVQTKIIPAGILKTINKKGRFNYQGGALLVQMTMPRYSYHLYAVPIAGQWLDYYNDQVLFVNSLSGKIRPNLKVRLNSEDYGWDQRERWKGDFPDVDLCDGVANINSLIENNRLFITTYNATTFLETLNLNIPTIIFWNCNHWELKEEARVYFDLLSDVGIFHKTPKSAAQQVNKVWNEVESWWMSDSTQRARITFCKKYSATLSSPIRKMQNILKV